MTATVRRTLLYDEHVALGGRMVEFAGWELPVQYEATGPQAEHRAVRTAAGLFDIDHMGQVRITGPSAVSFLNAVLSIDVALLPVWGAHYGLLPYADGGLVDDIFLYRLDDAWWMVVNAANRAKALAWLQAHAFGSKVHIEDISDATYMLALQGPKAQMILQKLADRDLDAVPYHTCTRVTLAGVPALIGATGYTGEYGYELYLPAESALDVWRALLAAGTPEGLVPTGLAARDSLRFEAALPLYGHEIGPDIDPISARLGRFVNFEKGPFIGRDALLKIKLEGPVRKLVGLEMTDPGVPRAGYPVQADGQVVGHVTTGMKAPTVGRFLAMVLIDARYAAVGAAVEVVVREQPKRAVVVPLPFYVPAYRRTPTTPP